MTTGYDIAQSAKAIAAMSPQAGYIFGTSGQKWTQADQDRITREKAGDSNYDYSIQYGSKWIGHKVYDCSGLTMKVHADNGVKLPHGSNSQYKVCRGFTGPAEDAPTGALVFKVRNVTDRHHVGVHVGEGKVVEAQGTKTGVIVSDLSSWDEYGLLPEVDYGNGSEFDPVPTPEPDPVPVEGGYMVVDVPNDGTVNLRDRADGKRIGTLCEGQSVRVVSQKDGWIEAELPRTVWIDGRFLRKGGG